MDDKFGLYLVSPEDIGDEEKHFLITPGYCLLYTKNAPPKKSEEIKEMKMLPALARSWLGDTIEEIRKQYLIEHQAEVLLRAKSFNDLFERELEAEKQRLKEMAGDSNG